MRRPNLLIAGAQKSGNSSLYRMLARHPEIFMAARKELNFFNRQGLTAQDFAEYLENFADAGAARYLGEATPHYFSRDRDGSGRSQVAERIAGWLGKDLRILLILRNPVERALAGWRHNYVYGRLGEAVSIFEAPPAQSLLELSHYARHWRAWTQPFDPGRFSVHLFDDLALRPRRLLRQVLAGLDLDFPEAAYAEFPFRQPFNNIRSNMTRQQVEAIPGFDAGTINRLVALFEADIAFVEAMTGRALPEWRDAGRIAAAFAEIR